MKLCTYLQEQVCGTQTGALITVSAENLRLEMGLIRTMHNVPIDIVRHYLTPCWYSKLLEFTAQSGIEVIDGLPKLIILRENDDLLMEKFIEAGYRRENLRKLNVIRMHLRVLSIADIATADGGNISSEAWYTISSNGLRDDLEWPRKETYIPSVWKKLWQEALLKAICQDYSTDQSRCLRYQLGDWYGEKHSQQWKTFVDREVGCIYRRIDQQWQVFRRTGTSLRKYYRANRIQELPSTVGDAISVVDHGTEEGDGYTMENCTTFKNTHPNEDPLEDNIATSTVPHGIQEKVRQLCERKMYLLDEVHLPSDEGKAIAEGIRSRTCAAVADGSFNDNKDNAGTAAFTIHANQGDRAPITGANWTTGRKQE